MSIFHELRAAIRLHHRRSLVAAAVLAVSLIVTGCQAGGAPGPSPATTQPPSPAASATPSVTPGGSPSPSPSAPSASESQATAKPSEPPRADVVIDVVVAGGKVTPNAENVRVTKGQTVLVSLTSDVDESIHIHGYDLSAEATPSKPGSVEFTADVSGVFEIETHETAKLVVKLIVS